ncbi:MAG: septum formation initiator family protein [Bacteroidetes bacterium]|nr:septum formation initiator family protein [Bacteroidota bacterium]
MRKSKLKQKLKKILKSPKLLLIAAVIMTISATLLFANKGIWRHIALRAEVASRQSEISALNLEERQLTSRVDLLSKEEPTMIERIARERYHLKRVGETIYREEKK